MKQTNFIDICITNVTHCHVYKNKYLYPDRIFLDSRFRGNDTGNAKANKGFTPLDSKHLTGSAHTVNPVRDKSLNGVRERSSLSGFTMIEMIIVVTIFAVIGAGVVSSFFSGMKIWQRVREVDFAHSYMLINLEGIAQELRQSIDIGHIGFSGFTDEVSFPCLRGNLIVNTTYSFDSSSKTFFRRQAYLADILSGEEIQYMEKKILSADKLSFGYLYFDDFKDEYNWKDEWKAKDGIFCALKIELESGGRNYTKTIFVPIAEN